MRFELTVADVQSQLVSVIQSHRPVLARWLLDFRERTMADLNMRAIEALVREGSIEPLWLSRFREEYGTFVTERVKPLWDRALAEGYTLTGERLERVFGGRGVLNYEELTLQYLEREAGALAVQLAGSQYEALRVILTEALREGQTIAEIRQRLMVAVGLVKRDVYAIIRYRDKVLALYDKERADKLVAKYYARHIRHRAERIARTEVAKAYNYAQDSVIKNYVAGSPGVNVVKRWRLGGPMPCALCQSLDGREVGIDGSYEIGNGATAEYPPAHPHCFCYVAYEAEV